MKRRNLKISVIAIPKTIDDDVMFVNRSFGYFTAISCSKDIIDSAHVAARCAVNGISIVKVMVRDSGFIAAGATLASQEVNFALCPSRRSNSKVNEDCWPNCTAACWNAIMR